jgi:hypothetical protein
LAGGETFARSAGALNLRRWEAANWPRLDEKAYYGLAGEAVRLLEPTTEADPAGMLMTLLVAFGNALGPTSGYMVAGGSRHPARLNVVLVGETSRSRKGTTWSEVSAVLSEADDYWYQYRTMGGLASGEGLIAMVRDGEGEGDKGVDDKRLFVFEPEFSRVLAVANRESNILSPTIRQAWDDGRLRVMTRNNPLKATGAHVSILGHVTRDELVKRLSSLEVANGFANRFMFCLLRRSKLLPNGARPAEDLVRSLAGRLRGSLEAARRIGEMHRSADATELWYELYYRMADAPSGMVGAITARAEAQVLRLSIAYGLLDGSEEITLPHLEAAWAVWQYAEDSAKQIFGTEALTGDPLADRLYPLLIETGELSRQDMRSFLGNAVSGPALEGAVQVLERSGLAETVLVKSTVGRPKLVTRLKAGVNGGPKDPLGPEKTEVSPR